MTRPLFEEGEEVILQSATLPHFNGEYSIHSIVFQGDIYTDRLTDGLVKATYNDDETKDIPGYLLDIPMLDPSTKYEIIWCQTALRKKHKGSDFSFSELMQDLKCKEPA